MFFKFDRLLNSILLIKHVSSFPISGSSASSGTGRSAHHRTGRRNENKRHKPRIEVAEREEWGERSAVWREAAQAAATDTSIFVTGNAVRLFILSYAARLRFDGHFSLVH